MQPPPIVRRRAPGLRTTLLMLLAATPILVGGWAVAGHLGPGRSLATTAATDDVALAGFTGRPGPASATVLNRRTSPTAFQAGMNVLVYGNDPEFLRKTKSTLDRLAALGVNTVSFAFPLFQTNWRSADVHADRVHTPSDENIGLFVQEAQRRGFTVMPRPLLDEESLHPDFQWRGSIQPTDPNAWFSSYTATIGHYASLAQANHVEMFDIGTELGSLQPDTAHWRGVIAAVRQLYSGELTYSANWTAPSPAFGSALDFLGVDAFFPLDAPSGASQAQLLRAWQAKLSLIEQAAKAAGKPVVVTEIGTTSENDSFQHPWIWHHAT